MHTNSNPMHVGFKSTKQPLICRENDTQEAVTIKISSRLFLVNTNIPLGTTEGSPSTSKGLFTTVQNQRGVEL